MQKWKRSHYHYVIPLHSFQCFEPLCLESVLSLAGFSKAKEARCLEMRKRDNFRLCPLPSLVGAYYANCGCKKLRILEDFFWFLTPS